MNPFWWLNPNTWTGTEEQKDYHRLSSNDYKKKHPEKYLERRIANATNVAHKTKGNMQLLEGVNDVVQGLTGSNMIADGIREGIYNIGTSVNRERNEQAKDELYSLVFTPENQWK